LNMYIAFTIILILHTKHYQNQSMQLEARTRQSWRIFSETQCSLDRIFVTYFVIFEFIRQKLPKTIVVMSGGRKGVFFSTIRENLRISLLKLGDNPVVSIDDKGTKGVSVTCYALCVIDYFVES